MDTKVIIDEVGSFDRKRLVQLHNKMIATWKKADLKAYWCVVIRSNGKQSGEWLNISCRNPESIVRVVVTECDQKPVYIN